MAGRTISHYELQGQLGQGGMGVVYKARDARLDRLVALKILPPDSVRDPDRRRRFVQEAKSASALNHPNIVTVYDIDSAGGVDFIAMEYVAGSTLEDLIGHKGLSLKDALRYAIQIADALSKAHAAGIIHRDLKPSNIMVTAEGQVKLLDFGLAKLVEPEESSDETPTLTASEQKITKEGKIVGTLAYMSPEQAEGKRVDARTDVFSFGAVLYQMLTGERPFRGDTQLELATALLRDDPKPPSRIRETLPPEVERVVLRCLRKDAQRRFQTMLDLKVVLEDLKEESDSGTLTPVTVARRRSRAWVVIAAAAVMVLAVATVALWWSRRPAVPPMYELTRLTFEPGLAAMPSISPDGKMLAFASDRNGNMDLYVQQINGRQASRLTSNPADDAQPCFSPDGTRIVFRSTRDGGGIYVVDTLGGPERKLADRGFMPRYSPDGATIAYVIPSPFSLIGRLYVMAAEGGTPRALQPDLAITMFGPGWPAPLWSPDSKHVLVRARREGQAPSLSWWIVPVDGGPAVSVPLPPVGPRVAIQGPDFWFGNYVYYTQGTTFGGANLFRVRLAANPWRIVGSPERLTSGTGLQWGISISTDGRLVFGWLTFQISPWSVALDGSTRVAKGAPEPLPTDTTGKLGLAVAANGSKLAYAAAMQMPDRMELRIHDLHSGREDTIPLTPWLGGPALQMSADGSKIAYRNSIGGKATYLVADTTGLTGAPVCDSCTVLGFFPDPLELLVAYGKQLFRQKSVDGSKSLLLEVRYDGYSAAAVSPDGRHVAFVTAKEDGDAALYIAPIGPQATPERDWIRIPEPPHRLLFNPRWSPDGTLLYYLSSRDDNTCVWALRIGRDGKPKGEPFEAFHSSHLLSLFNSGGAYGVTPDRLYMALGEVKGNIWTMQLEK